MRSRMIKIVAVIIAALFAVTLTGCESSPPSAAEKAASDRNKGVDTIRKNQPVSPMEHSPTLKTIDRWTKTWGKKGTVAYVYMKRQDGTLDGYYVLDGPPVNYCVSGSPTYDMVEEDLGESKGKMMVPAPGLDGAYYGGCDPSRYYGFDAVTGQVIEYTDGFIMTAQLSDQPLPLDKQPKPYVSSIEDVNKNKKP